MNPPLILAIITASGILLSSGLLPFQISEIYADESETNTDQDLSQKNVGGGDSINFNCGENSIGDSASILCESSPTGTREPPIDDDRFIATVRNCVRGQSGGNPTADCEIIAPEEFTPGRLDCFISFVPFCQVIGPSQDSGYFSCYFPREGTGPKDLPCIRS
jgi:hypothetical protein